MLKENTFVKAVLITIIIVVNYCPCGDICFGHPTEYIFTIKQATHEFDLNLHPGMHLYYMLQQKCFRLQTKFILNVAFRAAAGTPGEEGGIGLQDCCLPPNEMYIFQNKRQGMLADKKKKKTKQSNEIKQEILLIHSYFS